jgi:hypothetical protein
VKVTKSLERTATIYPGKESIRSESQNNKIPIQKLHKNPPTGSRDDICGLQAD